MIRGTSLLVALAFTPILVSTKTVYSGEFDYHSFESAKKYFSSRSASEITRMCDAGDHASNDDLAQCSHLKFERVNHELDRKLQLARAAFEHSDKSLKAEGEPLASPYFVKSQSAWVQYRDNACYTES
ncbi:lysozyme inhibitor LprI family protein [Paraburkholderia sp. 2C]